MQAVAKINREGYFEYSGTTGTAHQAGGPGRVLGDDKTMLAMEISRMGSRRPSYPLHIQWAGGTVQQLNGLLLLNAGTHKPARQPQDRKGDRR